MVYVGIQFSSIIYVYIYIIYFSYKKCGETIFYTCCLEGFKPQRSGGKNSMWAMEYKCIQWACNGDIQPST